MSMKLKKYIILCLVATFALSLNAQNIMTGIEVLKADPIPVEDGIARHVVLKGDQDPVNGDIGKDERDHDCRYEEEHIRPVALEIARKVTSSEFVRQARLFRDLTAHGFSHCSGCLINAVECLFALRLSQPLFHSLTSLILF